MKIETQNGTVHVSGLRALDGERAPALHEAVILALPDRPGAIEFDLAETTRVDCTGLGALVAIQAEARQRNPGAELRLLDPAPPVRQLLGLTRLYRLFAVVQRGQPVRT